ncbi:MAG: KpsF/GutQ family sugar-phosphate isomerase [Bacteroidetes bacterium]|nr:KpsF/GutQ family sugar-phosphate isomerase [Bacteroidota bacterium]
MKHLRQNLCLQGKDNQKPGVLWLFRTKIPKNLSPDHAKIIKNYGTATIQSELRSLQQIEGFVNDDFAMVVDLLLQEKGRAVLTGIGKSAIIAQKIVATMNSTGQPALFMHAADAVHGDLGMIQPGDVVIAISKSGNTPEIKVLAPLLRLNGNVLVAIVGNTESELARMADFVLNTTVDHEACPNNLAPTTSTTAQLLMGDALAVALLQMRNFSDEDFSRFHPGGALGKKLYLKCGDIAARNEKPAVRHDAAIREVIYAITHHRLGATAVLNSDGVLCGIVTDGDIRRMLEKYDNLTGLTASDIMTQNPQTMQAEELAAAAASLMQEVKITQLVVLQGKDYVGMVHLHDLNREGIL